MAEVADLQGANLGGTDLQGANLGGANLGGANLGWADLQGANLGGANLQGANLRGADLQGANLGWANLQGANLGWANLQGANLGGANLQGANLRGAAWVIPLGCPDGWVNAYAWLKDKNLVVQIGCRTKTLAEAREYWVGKDCRREVLAALDYAETVANLRNWELT